MYTEPQGILSRLYTDVAFREDFITDKKLFYKKYTITSPEVIKFIEDIPVSQIVFFAQSLITKRMHEVKNLLPGTSLLMGKMINEFFVRYSESYVPNGIHKHHDDAKHFVTYLLKQKKISDQKESDYYLRTILSYELQRIKNFISPKRFLISFYRHDLMRVYPLLLKTKNLNVPAKKKTIILWKSSRIIKLL